MTTVHVSLAERSYDIRLVQGDAAGAGPFARGCARGTLAFIVSDANTRRHADAIGSALAAAGFREDLEGPLFRPLRGNGQAREERRHLHPDMIDRILKKYAKRVGLGHSFSARSMRATFITTALDNGASLEDVQRDVGHADPTTTKLYDRRGHNPEKSASFFANY